MEKKGNSCYTYFAIKGNFNPDEITRILELSPTKTRHVGDSMPGGRGFYKSALWEYGRCNKYDVFTENQMMITISELKFKIPLLKEIKQKYDVVYVLEVVPEIYVEESTPALAPNREVIEFCYHTGTAIDIDLYVFE